MKKTKYLTLDDAIALINLLRNEFGHKVFSDIVTEGDLVTVTVRGYGGQPVAFIHDKDDIKEAFKTIRLTLRRNI